jgi:hypothetical protein
VRFVPAGELGPGSLPTIEIVASNASAKKSSQSGARFSVIRSGNLHASLNVAYTVSGTALNGIDYAPLSGKLSLAPEAVTTNIVVMPLGDSLLEQNETVTLTLLPSASYRLSSLSEATATIVNGPP